MHCHMGCPLLIALPHGLNVSGVTMWAIRLAGTLAERGRGAGLLLHGEPPGHDRLPIELPHGVRWFDLSGLPPIGGADADLTPHAEVYREAVGRLADRHGAPVALSPNLLGDCYGIAAALCRTEPGPVRVLGWNHSPIAYNDRVLAHYKPVISRFVAVSDRIEKSLRRLLPDRAADVVNVPYGVRVPAAPPRRPALRGRPVRLLYTGRIDHREKRILALPALSRELGRRGIDHELTIIGDGPAEGELEAASAGLETVRRLPPAPPGEIDRLLDASDALVLASRYEGLSVSMLEAMARGCVPIVTRVPSGVGQAVEEGRNGELADCGLQDDEDTVAAVLADAVQRFLSRDPPAMSESAWRTARDRFSLSRHADAVERVLDAVAVEPPRAWPVDASCGFDASVPPEGPDRLATLLHRLRGRRVVIHGTGRHTHRLIEVLTGSPAQIVAFTDPDRQRHGETLCDRPIVAPGDAAATGATDVVISSWINQQAIWGRRAEYETQGLSVHRLYE